MADIVSGLQPPSDPDAPLVSFDAVHCYLIQGLGDAFQGIPEILLVEEASRWIGRKSN
jgi:hypothetical protein